MGRNRKKRQRKTLPRDLERCPSCKRTKRMCGQSSACGSKSATQILSINRTCALCLLTSFRGTSIVCSDLEATPTSSTTIWSGWIGTRCSILKAMRLGEGSWGSPRWRVFSGNGKSGWSSSSEKWARCRRRWRDSAAPRTGKDCVNQLQRLLLLRCRRRASNRLNPRWSPSRAKKIQQSFATRVGKTTSKPSDRGNQDSDACWLRRKNFPLIGGFVRVLAVRNMFVLAIRKSLFAERTWSTHTRLKISLFWPKRTQQNSTRIDSHMLISSAGSHRLLHKEFAQNRESKVMIIQNKIKNYPFAEYLLMEKNSQKSVLKWKSMKIGKYIAIT